MLDSTRRGIRHLPTKKQHPHFSRHDGHRLRAVASGDETNMLEWYATPLLVKRGPLGRIERLYPGRCPGPVFERAMTYSMSLTVGMDPISDYCPISRRDRREHGLRQ